MWFLSLFAGAVLAAETIISPLADGVPVKEPMPAKPEVSFGEITAIPTPTPMPAVLGDEAPTPTPGLATKQKSYTVAFLGDSMTDTMGPGLPAIQSMLHAKYPSTTFTLLNYGVGATNIEYGIQRITNRYNYLGNDVPALASRRPDIVVVESFGYNPLPDADGGVNRHWIALANTVSTLRETIPGVKILLAATIAPNSRVFGDGAPGLAFGEMDKIQRTAIIKAYLDSTVKFARSERIPIADAYHASLDTNGEGMLTYINAGDHIHYSPAGRTLFAAKVVSVLQSML